MSPDSFVAVKRVVAAAEADMTGKAAGGLPLTKAEAAGVRAR